MQAMFVVKQVIMDLEPMTDENHLMVGFEGGKGGDAQGRGEEDSFEEGP